MSEDDLLRTLHDAVHTSRAARALGALADDVEAVLEAESAATLAWRTVPLSLYESLPDSIVSSWVFVLRRGTTSGAERHPNSIQRVMSFRNSGDFQMWDGHAWVSHELVSDPDAILADRWLSIPQNAWHRPVMHDRNWTVVSFHTALAEALIEERAMDDEHPGASARTAELYRGRQAR